MVSRKNIFSSFVGLFLLFAYAVSWGEVVQPDLKFVSSSEGAKLYKADRLNVLVLQGSYRQMGRQQGKLLKDQLEKFYDVAINNQLVKKEGVTFETLKGLSKSIFQGYPKRFREIVYGMAETSGMELDKLGILSQLLILTMITAADIHCSGIATWGDYTGGGPLIFGRNFDFPEYYKKFAEFLTVTVFNPDDGSNPTATIGYAGQIDALNGMNKEGLFLEVNDGTLSGGRVFANRISTLILNLGFLLDSSNMEQLDLAIQTARAGMAIVLNVADKNAAYSYECSIFDTKRRAEDRQGLLVATNHFSETSWNIAEPFPDVAHTMLRRKNFLSLGERYKGKFSPQTMKEVLGTPIEKGGATFPDGTVYQIIAVPQELKIWLKALGYTDWVEINLKPLFK